MVDIKTLFQGKKYMNEFVVGRTAINISGMQQNIDVFFERYGRRFLIFISEFSEIAISIIDNLFDNLTIYYLAHLYEDEKEKKRRRGV